MKDIQIQNIQIQRGKKLIYDAFSVNFEKGCITTVLAPSGAGKTTLLDCLAGLIVPEAGCVEGVSHPSYLFQEPRLLPWYSLEKNVLLPMKKFYSQEEAQNEEIQKEVTQDEEIQKEEVEKLNSEETTSQQKEIVDGIEVVKEVKE